MRARPAPRARPLSGSRCVHPRQTKMAMTPWTGHILLLPERRDDNRRFGFPQARTFAQKGGSQRTPRDRRPLPKASLAPLGGPPPDRTRPFPSPWPLPPVPLSPPPRPSSPARSLNLVCECSFGPRKGAAADTCVHFDAVASAFYSYFIEATRRPPSLCLLSAVYPFPFWPLVVRLSSRRCCSCTLDSLLPRASAEVPRSP